MALAGAGDRVVVSEDRYGVTRRLFEHELARLGVPVNFLADFRRAPDTPGE